MASPRSTILIFLLLAVLAPGYAASEGAAGSRKGNFWPMRELVQQLEIVQMLADMRSAYESKNPDALMKLVSKRFYEMAGTPDEEDDYDYYGLRQVLTKSFKMAKEITVDIQLRGIEITGDRASVKYYHVTRFLMILPDGEKWVAMDDETDMRLIREEGYWKVISGL